MIQGFYYVIDLNLFYKTFCLKFYLFLDTQFSCSACSTVFWGDMSHIYLHTALSHSFCQGEVSLYSLASCLPSGICN